MIDFLFKDRSLHQKFIAALDDGENEVKIVVCKDCFHIIIENESIDNLKSIQLILDQKENDRAEN